LQSATFTIRYGAVVECGEICEKNSFA